ncbi:hypothetical protein NE237_000492 [Protea cynaroides]|uniref:Uncharacterized protein n=1 Tax=Protea cynaroides TaxID=273540 RepID=A0A9Q0KRJ5_9MAGN|nr:hypothetical protein NE237_000492 [Protea cynaroides]
MEGDSALVIRWTDGRARRKAINRISEYNNGWNNGGINCGYGSGYGSPGTMVYKEHRPCYKKKLTCLTKCFTSYNHSSKNYGFGSRSSDCTIDCKKKCTASC